MSILYHSGSHIQWPTKKEFGQPKPTNAQKQTPGVTTGRSQTGRTHPECCNQVELYNTSIQPALAIYERNLTELLVFYTPISKSCQQSGHNALRNTDEKICPGPKKPSFLLPFYGKNRHPISRASITSTGRQRRMA